VSACIATCREHTGVDILIGIGGAPEGVISAAALRCTGGDFQGILKFRNDEEKRRAEKMGVTQFDKVYSITELAKGNVMFCATGVTDGNLLKGVRFEGASTAYTHSLVMRSNTGTVREITAEHHLDRKP
jgi:fructose-1,6-bisphosphatase/sedoheptulose 1,7-bisphosphatase-like protein